MNRAAALLLCSMAVPHYGAAGEIEPCAWDTCVKPAVVINGEEIPLRSLVPFRYWGFKVYVAALYAPVQVKRVEDELGVFPLRLELHYYRNFTARDFIDAAQQTLEKNPDVDLEKIGPQLALINAVYADVVPGDVYALEYDPAAGLTLLRNDAVQVTVPGRDFARAYLGIWLSPYSVSSSLTESLVRITGND